MAKNPGPAFWQTTFGIPDFDTFVDRVGPYLPDVHWFGIGPSATDIALLAWQDPLSTPGNVAAIALAVQGLAGVDSTAVHSAIRNVAPRAQLEQENSMGQLIVPGCFQVAIEAQSGSQDVTNVIGVQNSGGTAAGAAAAVQAAWKATGGPLDALSSLYVLKGFRAMDLSSSNGALAYITDTTPGRVTASNSLATNGACALVKWNGATRSKSSRGRMYFGPIMEVNVNPDGRTLTSSTLTNVGGNFNVFRSSLSSAGYPLVVLSRTLQTSFPVSGAALESVIATQRRRIRG